MLKIVKPASKPTDKDFFDRGLSGLTQSQVDANVAAYRAEKERERAAEAEAAPIGNPDA